MAQMVQILKTFLAIFKKIKNYGSNGQHFKNIFSNFEAQIGQKLRTLRLGHFCDVLIKKTSVYDVILLAIQFSIVIYVLLLHPLMLKVFDY